MKGKASKSKLIVNHVIAGIREGRYKMGDKIPSINEFRETYQLARDTVFAGLRELKAKGIIESNHGIGYHIISTNVAFTHNIFLLFNEFNEFKEDLYNSFMETIGTSVTVDLYFHNYNRRVFETLLNEARGKYTDYIIMSGKFTGIAPLLQSLQGRVFLLDHFHAELKGRYSSVFQNFERDTYDALLQGITYLKKYSRIIMVQQDEKEPQERYEGLCAFCKKYQFDCKLVGTVKKRRIRKGDVFMVVNDRDLVNLLKYAKYQKLTPGTDFGIISYNDTPLKEILSGGITTLSTDFKLMGKTIAQLLNKPTLETVENPCMLNIRKSL
jgi:DNA-binding LacI/PurR family transcriptional regulator